MPFGTDALHIATACLMLVGCTGTPEPPASAPQRLTLHQPEPRMAAVVPSWPDAWFEALLATTGPDEARDFLRAGCDESELRYRGFDGVTLGDSIDAVVGELPAYRALPRPDLRAPLVREVDVYWALQDEVIVRRTAGAGSCLPAAPLWR